MFGQDNRMSPDDHYQDLKRVILACSGKSRRINVIMPFLYESRQHKRNARESLDCAFALEELYDLGVANIITFDAHDERVANAIPLAGFESLPTTYQIIKEMYRQVPDLSFSSGKFMIISPDEGGIGRAMYYASILGVPLGTFYKRRDYTTVVNGRNPIVAHEFLGDSVEGMEHRTRDEGPRRTQGILRCYFRSLHRRHRQLQQGIRRRHHQQGICYKPHLQKT